MLGDNIAIGVLGVAGLVALLACSANAAFFVEPFDDPNVVTTDDSDLNNFWVKTGDLAYLDPCVVNGELVWVNHATVDAQYSATVTRILNPSNDVSADMMFPKVGHDETAGLYFKVYDASGNSVFVSLTSIAEGDWQSCRIWYNGVHQLWTGVAGPTSYHNYQIKISETGAAFVYFDGERRWRSIDGVMGDIVKVEFYAHRWWQYHEFFVDNFIAMGTPETCAEVQFKATVGSNPHVGVTIDGDLNGDCHVGLPDLTMMAADWLKNNDPQAN